MYLINYFIQKLLNLNGDWGLGPIPKTQTPKPQTPNPIKKKK